MQREPGSQILPPDRESVLVVEPDPKICRSLVATLEAEGLYVEAATEAQGAAQRLDLRAFDLLICDLVLLTQSQLGLVERMGSESPGRRVILTARRLSRETALEVLQWKVHDLLLKPFDLAAVRKTISDALRQIRLKEENQWYLQLLEAKNLELQELNQKLKKLAITDPLTGLFNHGRFVEELHREFGRARRYRTPLTLSIFDIDDFKQYNDTHGHLDGDELLRQLCRLMAEKVRKEDILCRYGGEEFTLVQPMTSRAEAIHVAKRILRVVGLFPFGRRTGQPRHVTLSGGLASLGEEFARPNDLIRAADEALYRAKGAGKNRLVVYRQGEFLDSGAIARSSVV